jgi:hypothetical protein
MKLRVLPIVLTVAVSTILLFGGWFAYRSYAMENPLAGTISSAQGVQQVDTVLNKDNVMIDLKLAGDADLESLYRKVTTDGASIIGSREVKFKLNSDSSPELEKWWSTALFDIAQAMETKHYSDIPQILDKQSSKLAGMSAVSEMDEKNVYIRLSLGDKTKYIILPRTPAVLGALSQ